MSTFSEIVDELATVEFNRPHLKVLIASYLNQTIRDVHSRKDTRTTVRFGENLREIEFTPVSEPIVWSIPDPPNFQAIEAVYLPSIDKYLTERLPSSAHRSNDNPSDRYYWYRTGSAFALNGVMLGQTVQIAYYEFPGSLRYVEPAQRPPAGGTLVIVEQGVPVVVQMSNWLLDRYGEQLKEGVRAKLYRRLDNEIQARLSWSEFESVREAIHLSEGA